MKAVEEKNRGEMNVFSQGRGEDYGELLESVSYRRGAGQIISDWIAYVHNKPQILFPVSRGETSSAQNRRQIN